MKYYAVSKTSKRDCSGIVAKAVISSPTRDLAGTVVLQEGMDCPERVSLLSSHDDKEVIGYAHKFARENGQTVAEVVIMSVPHASLVRNGALEGISVGLDVLEGEDRPGGTISKSTLLELSLTPVPANPDAKIVRDTIKPFCTIEEGGKKESMMTPSKQEPKNKTTRTADGRLMRQVKHYRGAVKARLLKLKKIVG